MATRVHEVSFPLATVEPASSIRVSEYIECGAVGYGREFGLRFTHKPPRNEENLFYFCCGYVDAKTFDYYTCFDPMDAEYPLLSLAEVMPEKGGTAMDFFVDVLRQFSPDDAEAFGESLTGRPRMAASIIGESDFSPALYGVMDGILAARTRLNQVRDALEPYAGTSPENKASLHHYWKFCEVLNEAAQWLSLHLECRKKLTAAGYGARESAKVMGLFNLPLFEKAEPGVDIADEEELRRLWPGQQDGSLVEEVVLNEP